MATRDDIVWLAGITDGEGCIFLQRRTDYVHRPSGANRKGRLTRIEIRCALRICMAHHPSVDRIAGIMLDLVSDPTKVHLQLESRHKSRIRPLKNAVVTNRDTVREVMQVIEPFLFTKKMEAQLMLLYANRAKGHVRYRATDYDSMLAELATDLRHGRGEARAQEFLRQVIPSQVASGRSSLTSVETKGVETTELRPNNNAPHECPAPDRQLRLVEGEDIVRSPSENSGAA